MKNPPAFPHAAYDSQPETPKIWHDGMTLRDYFAAQAIQGMVASAESEFKLAEWAYALADAMLAEREK